VNGYGTQNGSTASFELYNTTDAAQVVVVTTTATAVTTMMTSSAISLINGKTYTIRARHAVSGQTAVLICGYLKIV
jgi:hypothetical protein